MSRCYSFPRSDTRRFDFIGEIRHQGTYYCYTYCMFRHFYSRKFVNLSLFTKFSVKSQRLTTGQTFDFKLYLAYCDKTFTNLYTFKKPLETKIILVYMTFLWSEVKLNWFFFEEAMEVEYSLPW